MLHGVGSSFRVKGLYLLFGFLPCLFHEYKCGIKIILRKRVTFCEDSRQRFLCNSYCLLYTRSVWGLGLSLSLSVRHIFSMARRNDAE